MAIQIRDVQLQKAQDEERFKQTTPLIPVVLTDAEGRTEVSGATVSAEVEGSSNEVWGRAYGDAPPFQYLNNDAAPAWSGIPVWVGYREGSTKIEVLGVNWSAVDWTQNIPGGGLHAAQHEEGGYDPVDVSRRMRTELKCTVDLDGFKITVGPWEYRNDSGERVYFKGKAGYDLAASQPASGLARWVLVRLDKSTNALALTNGDTGPDVTTYELTKPDCPAGSVPSAYLRVSGDASGFSGAVRELDDARVFLNDGSLGAIDDLSDVTIDGTPADNELLAYDTGTGEFINQTPTEAGISEIGHDHANDTIRPDEIIQSNLRNSYFYDINNILVGADMWATVTYSESPDSGSGNEFDPFFYRYARWEAELTSWPLTITISNLPAWFNANYFGFIGVSFTLQTGTIDVEIELHTTDVGWVSVANWTGTAGGNLFEEISDNFVDQIRITFSNPSDSTSANDLRLRSFHAGKTVTAPEMQPFLYKSISETQYIYGEVNFADTKLLVDSNEVWHDGNVDGKDVASLGSGAATNGYMATADGAGGVDWEAPPGAGSGITAADAWGGNLICNSDILYDADAAQPVLWLEEDGDVTLTKEDAAGESIPEISENVFKLALNASGGGKDAYQTITLADEPLLDPSVTEVSAGVWVYTADAGTVTFELYDDGGSASLGTDTTTTTGSWVQLTVENVTIGTTSLSVRVTHSANSSTMYFSMPQFNAGSQLLPYHPRKMGQQAVVIDRKSNGTPGGTFTSGAWYVRDLTQVVKSAIPGLSLSSNRISLRAGVYRVSASAPAWGVTNHVTKLHNNTDGVDLLDGTSEYAYTNTQTRSHIEGIFILTGTKDIDVRHACATTIATFGRGIDTQTGLAISVNNEVYTTVELERLA